MARSAGSTGNGLDARSPAAALRRLPSVEEVASRLHDVPHDLAVSAARAAISARREALREGTDPGPLDVERIEADARARAEGLLAPRLRSVLNATGVIVHTNLGRAPLPGSAADAVVAVASGYSNLEYDLESGRRGSRHAHCEEVLQELTGADAAIVVNNCAAAVLLGAAALAAGREIVVSRGQLIEIGGSFRIPDVVAQSGARLVEVGTTNRTRLADYEEAVGPETGAILRAHPSNFRAVGFTEEVAIEDLCDLARERRVPVIDDAGSGALAAGIPELFDEPVIGRSVVAGSALVCFSGDKLLGGPQAGVIVGSRESVDRCRHHPLARALRPDKMQLAALEATLVLYRDPARARAEVPVLRMLTAGEHELGQRAELIRSTLEAAGVEARIVSVAARAGGGALPLLELEGPACSVDPGETGLDELSRRLRASDPPVVARRREGRLLLDPRTLTDAEARTAAQSVVSALG